jgi:hypothetical protein
LSYCTIGMGFVEIINHHQPLRQRPHSGTGTGSGVWSLDVRVFKHTLQTKLNRDCMRQCTCSCGRMENGERRKEKGEEGVEGFLFGTIALYCFHATRKYSFIHRSKPSVSQSKRRESRYTSLHDVQRPNAECSSSRHHEGTSSCDFISLKAPWLLYG